MRPKYHLFNLAAVWLTASALERLCFEVQNCNKVIWQSVCACVSVCVDIGSCTGNKGTAGGWEIVVSLGRLFLSFFLFYLLLLILPRRRRRLRRFLLRSLPSWRSSAWRSWTRTEARWSPRRSGEDRPKLQIIWLYKLLEDLCQVKKIIIIKKNKTVLASVTL